MSNKESKVFETQYGFTWTVNGYPPCEIERCVYLDDGHLVLTITRGCWTQDITITPQGHKVSAGTRRKRQ